MNLSHRDKYSRIGREHAFPLTGMQAAIYQRSLRADAGEGAYVRQVIGRFPLDLDPALFRKAFEAVVARHDALRLRFLPHGALDPVQYVAAPRLPWTRKNLSGLSEEERDGELAAYLAKDRREGFDLAEAPPLRVLFEQLGPGDCRFVLTVHHAVIDSCSLAYVLDEVFRIHDALAVGAAPELPAPASFRDYVGRLGALSLKAEEAFWRGRLKGFSAPSDLKFPQAERRGYGDRAKVVRAGSAEEYARRAADLGVTVNAMLQGAWAMTLARFSGGDDVVFGATKSVRHGPGGGERAVGLYLNTLAVRAVYDPDMGLGEWLRRIRDGWTSAWPHENAPYRLQRACADISSHAPLYSSLLIVEREPLGEKLKKLNPKWGAGTFRVVERTPFPISLSTYLDADMRLNLEFDRSIFADGDAERVLESFAHVFRTMAEADEDRPLRDFPFFPDKELRFLLGTGRSETPGAARPECVHLAFERQAAAMPESPALVEGDATLTYRELRDEVRRMAGRLAGMGVEKGDAVALCLPRSIDLVTAMYAAWTAGACYVPVDPELPDSRKEYILEHARAKAVVAKREFLPPGARTPALFLDSGREDPPPGPLPEDVSPDDPAYILYTSGTTGEPKGVVVQHRALDAFLKAATPRLGLGPGDRVLQFASASFDAAAEEIHGALTTGAALILRTVEMAGSAEAFFDFCETRRISVVSLPTAYWNVLAATMPENGVSRSLRLVIVGGEQLRFPTLARWRSKAGTGIRLLDSYGPTEAAVEVALADLTDYSGPDDPPLGEMFPGMRAYVLNRRLEPVPVRVEGELLLAGDQLALGYLNDPERTAEAFFPADALNRLLASVGLPLETGPVYRTGDLVRMREDGGLEFIGRKDAQVKVRGYRIELGEIESRLAALPEIAAAAAKVVEAPPGNRFIAAYAAPSDTAERDGLEALVREGLRKVLPPFMLPGAYVFLDRLPLTANGKVDYAALPAPRGKIAEKQPAGRYEDALERMAAEVWGQTLGVRDVGPDSDFFALGGDSLSAIMVASELQHRTGVALPTMALYQAPTPRLLAGFLREAAPVKTGILEPIQPKGGRPPLFFVGATSLLGPLADRLGTDQPLVSLNVFGLQPLLEEAETLDLRVIAEIYINEIRRVQGKGPYLLAGYCLDAVLAFEMAKQLRRAGEKTALLLSIDGVWDAGSRGFGIKRHLDNLQIFGPSYLSSKFRQKYRQWRTSFMLSYSRFKAFLSRPGASSVPPSLKNALFLDKFFKSFETYEARPYAGRITLFLSSEWNSLELPELSALAEGGLDIHEIRGFHDGWFNQPQVDVFAEKLKECIKAALERKGH